MRYNIYNGCMQLFIPTPNECLSLHHRAHTNIDVIHLKCNFSRHISSFNKRMNKPIYSCLKIKCLQQFSRIVVSTSLSFLSALSLSSSLSSWLIAFPLRFFCSLLQNRRKFYLHFLIPLLCSFKIMHNSNGFFSSLRCKIYEEFLFQIILFVAVCKPLIEKANVPA